ncbi:CGNR zinc finger domain-containing protein [Mesorhizobium sp. WSM4976]|uniref:CGNR zinc finger domain-containing protein n=1 Tax=Mesorhizobium sp. WSM4976 TaxID=3038549 RepID=UPI002416A7C5|nr:CGNR zinc finger domain-containing protein [Mesorhizobium sp. WSM4976]MDG4897756.1 CGNR zinc finger domain-containing protein [Mesorhizobium sp. WSM4976]
MAELLDKWTSRSFIGGNQVLDFLNTQGGDTKARDFERLRTYSDVLTWAVAAEVLDSEECGVLRELAADGPDLAQRCLEELRDQRESLYRLITSTMSGSTPAESDRSAVEMSFRSALRRARLLPGVSQLRWYSAPDEAGLSLVQFRLAIAASMLITDAASQNIRQCETCSWLFLDTSATKRRRWCSMAVCGNRAKAQRHYHRNKR